MQRDTMLIKSKRRHLEDAAKYGKEAVGFLGNSDAHSGASDDKLRRITVSPDPVSFVFLPVLTSGII